MSYDTFFNHIWKIFARLRSLLPLLAALILVSCEDLEINQLPFPELVDNQDSRSTDVAYIYELTGTVTGLTPNTSVTNYGHIWSSENSEPTLENYEGIDNKSNGNRDQMDNFTFTSTTDQLCPAKRYYFRSYSIVNNEVYYSEIESFTTDVLSFSSSLSITSSEWAQQTASVVLKLTLEDYPVGLNTSRIGFYWEKANEFIEDCADRDSVRFDPERTLILDNYEKTYEIAFCEPGDYNFRPFIENCEQITFGDTAKITIRFPWFPWENKMMDARFDAVGFAIGQRGYVGLGDAANEIKQDFWEFDTLTRHWNDSIAGYDGTQRYSAAGFSLDNNKAYIGLGFDINGENKKDFWEYDPDTNNWSPKEEFEGDARKDAISFSIGNKGYIGLGYSCAKDTIFYRDFWEFDPSGNDGRGKWSPKTPFPPEGKPRFGAVSFSINGKGFVGTGRSDNGELLKDFWVFDPSGNNGKGEWNPITDLDGDARSAAVGFAIGDRGYIGTGIDDKGEPLKDFWAFDPSGNGGDGQWIRQTDFAGEARFGAVGFAIGDKGYIGTGNDGSFLRNDFWVFDPKAESTE